MKTIEIGFSFIKRVIGIASMLEGEIICRIYCCAHFDTFKVCSVIFIVFQLNYCHNGFPAFGIFGGHFHYKTS